jgi:hypothetical protein
MESTALERNGFCCSVCWIDHEAGNRSRYSLKASKKKPKPKLKSIAKVRDELAVALQKLVRLKAADEYGFCACVTCNKRYHWKDMQGGHFIGRTKIATKVIEENINPQCRHCNLRGMKQTSYVLKYRQWMVEMHGEDFVEWLRAESDRIVKHRRDELEQQIDEANAQIKQLERQLETRAAA